MVYLIGIDDAGRGPVIGPMILAGVIIEEKEEEKIVSLGAKDSKLLLPKKRKLIGDILIRDFQFEVQKVTPEEIDSGINLNHLEAQKMAIVINALAEKTNEKIIAFVDCPSVNIEKWSEYLWAFIIKKDKIELRAEHKADSKYPVVSAASIIAKESREEEVSKLKELIKKDFGSGYPSDPKTVSFIQEYFEDEKYAKIIRHSWESVKRLKNKKLQKELS